LAARHAGGGVLRDAVVEPRRQRHGIHGGLRCLRRSDAGQLLALPHHGVDGPVDVLIASLLRAAMVARAMFAAFSNAATTALILFALASAVPSATKLVISS